MEGSSRILGRPTGREAIEEPISEYPQKKFRFRPEYSFQLQICSALWGKSETAILEAALESYIDSHASEGEARKVYPVARRLHQRWIRGYSSSKRSKLHTELRAELRDYVDSLKKRNDETSRKK